ncbi:MAG: FprA family A-type flavoprotein [Ruminococcus sp.]|uniref:FprA family A-type flavoprotein n=1 Tax=Ruminococcus sp. TaxID=41978 RepID=UPI0025E3A5EB|nr:FprA family A-type flavoprotein [Ruminococcus sp.]MBO4867104.1 FprA family A-type flavoprotein [Ruminococcus sp.]
MTEIKISESIVYIGADDKDLDLFESQYDVPNGMAYNSYAILDDKVCIMDTADKRVSDVWLANVKKALGDRKADYLVVQHVEPDHSGNIAKLMAEYPDMKVVGNAKTFTMLGQFFNIPDIGARSVIVKEGDTLELGKHTLKFFMTPMVHWPEVMMTFEVSEGAFFSADAFGKFGTLDTDEDWACEARRYYFNIVGKYGAQVQAVLKKAAALDIKMILPLHGPILTENLGYYIDLYNTWSSYEPENKGIFIACASIHGNTLAAAEKLKEMLEARGAEKVSLSDITRDDQAEAVEDAFRYDRLVLMSSSYDGGVFPPMEELLMHLRDKTYRNRKIAIVENGSWAPSAARVIKSYVEKFKDITLVEPVVTIKSALNAESEKALEELADALTAK